MAITKSIVEMMNGKIEVESEKGVGTCFTVTVTFREIDHGRTSETGKIRALDRDDAKVIPIIALTANAFDEDVQSSLQAGLDAHLSKPVEPEDLFRTLEELIHDD